MVEDNAGVRDLLKEYLTEQGYRVICSNNGREGLYTARHHPPDLILLDIMMPEMDGLEFLKAFRKTSDTPIIFLTAKVMELDKVLGLELGADDYITKPFSMAELLARIRAVMRRTEGTPSRQVFEFPGLSLDREARVVKVSGKTVDLTRSEFDLLSVFLESPSRVFKRTELLDRLQEEDALASERTIDVHVRNLRSKIEEDPSQPRHIVTVFGVGYRFNPEEG
ncbi:DNA-binding response regulator [Deinococcus cellulosilyticus NBRC 106333 = KACC 11606]|uniref:DNA-binding response regulator n=1 Tax=Deinococcus cellulosilyticus (strain DSM 18568 / NBRC 106333 / KACC 11606 / 5516J-15) TaxID=1223518 RepID=A0A511MVE7_DEIC1|nr:DNA-binding response regulator [Deinococcus cellulosilyticus NBRC 106333 = KACC 11606]